MIAVGAMAQLAVDSAAQAYREGVGVTVIDPRWVRPLPISTLARMSDRYSRIVVIEDGIKSGGISSALSDSFRELDISIPIHSIGVPLEFIEHSKRHQILEDLGITVQSVARQLVTWFSSGSKQEETQLHVDESAARKPTH